MAWIGLTASQRRQLQHLAQRGRDARVVRWAQALLWLDQGEHPIAVAQRLALTLESVYAWARRLRLAETNYLAQRLTDQPRSGRLVGKRQAVQQMVQTIALTPESGSPPSPVPPGPPFPAE
jgi:hypothetical protein